MSQNQSKNSSEEKKINPIYPPNQPQVLGHHHYHHNNLRRDERSPAQIRRPSPPLPPPSRTRGHAHGGRDPNLSSISEDAPPMFSDNEHLIIDICNVHDYQRKETQIKMYYNNISEGPAAAVIRTKNEETKCPNKYPALPPPPLHHPHPRHHKRKKPESSHMFMQTSDHLDQDYDDGHSVLQTSKNKVWVWGSDEVDTQDVGTDTKDLKRLMPYLQHFNINFTRFGDEQFSLQVGLRRKYAVKHSFTPPTTDDYVIQVLRHLRSHPSIRSVKLVLELHPDDDVVLYKKVSELKDVMLLNDPKSIPDPFPVLWSKRNSTFLSPMPNKVTFIHIEIPGISPPYLQDWKEFLEQQGAVKTLICNFGSILWTFFTPTIHNNEQTLEKITLRRIMSYDVPHEKHIPLDFEIFQNCKELQYLKITGGGWHKDLGLWGEWLSLGYEQPQEEILLHVNFHKIPTGKLTEVHFSKMIVNKNRLAELKEKGGENLKVICWNCPDREYTDGDWKNPHHDTTDYDYDSVEQAAKEIQLALDLMLHHHQQRGEGYPVDRTLLEELMQQQRRKSNLIKFLFILSILSMTGMIVMIWIAASRSNK